MVWNNRKPGKRNGPPPRSYAEVIAGILARCDTSGGPHACWPVGGYCLPNGRGLVNARGFPDSSGYTHVWMLEHKLGRRLHPGMKALHTCDNPACNNPAHLYEGTQANNLADAVARGHTRGRHSAVVPTPRITDHPWEAGKYSTRLYACRTCGKGMGRHMEVVR